MNEDLVAVNEFKPIWEPRTMVLLCPMPTKKTHLINWYVGNSKTISFDIRFEHFN